MYSRHTSGSASTGEVPMGMNRSHYLKIVQPSEMVQKKSSEFNAVLYLLYLLYLCEGGPCVRECVLVFFERDRGDKGDKVAVCFHCGIGCTISTGWQRRLHADRGAPHQQRWRRAALASLSRLSFPALPRPAWPGKPSRAVHLERRARQLPGADRSIATPMNTPLSRDRVRLCCDTGRGDPEISAVGVGPSGTSDRKLQDNRARYGDMSWK